jgi:hypothetical protein
MRLASQAKRGDKQQKIAQRLGYPHRIVPRGEKLSGFLGAALFCLEEKER